MRIILIWIILYSLKCIETENLYKGIKKSACMYDRGIQHENINTQTNNQLTVTFFGSSRSKNDVRQKRYAKHCNLGRETYFPRYRKYRQIQKSHKRKLPNIRSKCRTLMRRNRAPVEFETRTEWDNWSDWSECSVTCGEGRRIRWRHCIGEDCPKKGLKRAQMKPCNLKACSKGILSWLGIKHKQK